MTYDLCPPADPERFRARGRPCPDLWNKRLGHTCRPTCTLQPVSSPKKTQAAFSKEILHSLLETPLSYELFLCLLVFFVKKVLHICNEFCTTERLISGATHSPTLPACTQSSGPTPSPWSGRSSFSPLKGPDLGSPVPCSQLPTHSQSPGRVLSSLTRDGTVSRCLCQFPGRELPTESVIMFLQGLTKP